MTVFAARSVNACMGMAIEVSGETILHGLFRCCAVLEVDSLTALDHANIRSPPSEYKLCLLSRDSFTQI